MTDFTTFGLAPAVLAALDAAEISTPTPIQAKCIPLALEGHDIMGLAQTGTGKTLAFALPLIQRLHDQFGKPAPKTVKALVLAPTRELVNQIADNIRPIIAGTPLKVATVVGGQPIHRQIQRLSRGTDILVATPGRLIDLMEQGAVDLSTVRQLVLDEADQMLDLGFIHALRRIAPALGAPRQTLMFSATMAKQMEELSESYLTDPQKVQVAPPGKTADKIEQSMEFIDKAAKPRRLREILRDDMDALTLVFARTKHGAEKMKKQLVADGFSADSVHGNKSQSQRDRAIKAFREGTVKILVATDVAARGIDIPGVARVINHDLPNVPEAYVHRIGRTARAGRDGVAISFCAPDEQKQLREIEKLLKRRFDGNPEAPKQAGKKPQRTHPRPETQDDGTPAQKPQKSRRRKPRRTTTQGSETTAPTGQGKQRNGKGPGSRPTGGNARPTRRRRAA